MPKPAVPFLKLVLDRERLCERLLKCYFVNLLFSEKRQRLIMKIILQRIYIRGEITEGRLTIDGCCLCDTLENSGSCLPAGSYPLSIIPCKLYARQMLCVTQPPTDLSRPKKGQATDQTKRPANGSAKGTATDQAVEPTKGTATDQAVEPAKRPTKASVAACTSCCRLDFVGANTRLPRFCPQIKAGNGIHNRWDGSILVGSLTDPNDPTRNCHGCLLHPQAAFDNLFDRIRMSVNRGHEIELIIRD